MQFFWSAIYINLTFSEQSSSQGKQREDAGVVSSTFRHVIHFRERPGAAFVGLVIVFIVCIEELQIQFVPSSLHLMFNVEVNITKQL